MKRNEKIELLRSIATGRKTLDHLNNPPLPIAGIDGEYDREPGYFTCIDGKKISTTTIERLKRENPDRIITVIF